MISGLSLGVTNITCLTLTVSTAPVSSFLQFRRVEHDDEGAWYEFQGLLYTRTINVLVNELGSSENKVWFCNVMHDVFGEHPEEIYLLDIKKEA